MLSTNASKESFLVSIEALISAKSPSWNEASNWANNWSLPSLIFVSASVNAASKSISLGKVFSTTSNDAKTVSIPVTAVAIAALKAVSTVANDSLHTFNVASAASNAVINASVI